MKRLRYEKSCFWWELREKLKWMMFTSWKFWFKMVKHHHFEIRDIYILIHGCFFFPVVFGKKFARRIGRKRVDPGAAGRNQMAGPIGSASALAVKLQHRKKKNGPEVKSTMKIIVATFGLLEISYLKCSFCIKHPCFSLSLDFRGEDLFQ